MVQIGFFGAVTRSLETFLRTKREIERPDTAAAVSGLFLADFVCFGGGSVYNKNGERPGRTQCRKFICKMRRGRPWRLRLLDGKGGEHD